MKAASITALFAALIITAAQANAGDLDGTRIHVKNGTNRTLVFDLLVKVKDRGAGKFDTQIKLEPGQTAVWTLAGKYEIGTYDNNGKVFYQVGLRGKDPQTGEKYHWGLLGGDGMYGIIKDSNLHVRPVGQL